MNSLNNTTQSLYDYLFVELADKRTSNWFLMKDPIANYTIIGLYLLFVLKLGPEWMKNRKPFNLTRTLIVYNFLQVILSTWLFYESLDGAWLKNYNWRCEPIDYSYAPDALRVCRGVYVFYLAKISELLDTVFFVLRKKQNQVTFLHLYHHTIMPSTSWVAAKYIPGGHEIFLGFINSFVHIIMYTYYLLAAMGPQYQKYLFWKPYITTLQLAQFCVAFLHSAQLIFVDCGYPRWTLAITLPNAIFFYYLFNDFYRKAYKKKPSQDTVVKKIKDSVNGNGAQLCTKKLN